MPTKRQNQIARLIQVAIGEVLQRKGHEIHGGVLVTVTQVTVTPDLQDARISLSIYNAPDKRAIVDAIIDRTAELRKALGERIRNQVRSIPTLRFFQDETLDEVFRMEELFRKLHEEDQKKSEEK